MVKLLIRLLLVLVLAGNAGAAIYTNTTSGLFSSGSTWVGGVAPNASNDAWVIKAGTTVEYDGYNTNGTPYAAGTINGSFIITNQTNLVWLEMAGNISGTGTWTIASAGAPILQVSTNVETVVVAFRSGAITMTKTGALNWYGETRLNTNSTVWTPLAQTATNGATTLVLTDDLQLRTNDIISVDGPLSNQHYPNTSNLYFVVQNYVAATKTVTIGSSTNFTGDRFGGTGAEGWTGINSGGLTSTRSNGVCGVTLVTRPILMYFKNRVSSTGIINNSNGGVAVGVRCSNADCGFLNNVNNWSCTSIVGNSCNTGNSYQGTGHIFYNVVANGCNYGNSYGGTGHTFYNVVANGCAVGNSYNGTGYTFYNVAANGCTYGNSYQGTGHTFYNAVANGCQTGNSYNGTGYTFYNVVANGCNYGNSYQGAGNTFYNAVANGCTYGNSYNGTGHTFYNATTSNCTTRISYQDYGLQSFNNTRSGTSTRDVLANSFLTDSPYNFTFVSDTPSNTWWYQTTGVVSAQTKVVTSPMAVTMQHVTTAANQPTRWYLTSTVRPNATGRWTTYLLRDSTNSTVLAELYPNKQQAGIVGNVSLTAVTNTSGANTWQVNELVWANTNSAQANVTLWFTGIGAVGSTNYTFGTKGIETNIKVIP